MRSALPTIILAISSAFLTFPVGIKACAVGCRSAPWEEYTLSWLMHLVWHMGRVPYESVAAPVSNNAADLVELNNVAAPK